MFRSVGDNFQTANQPFDSFISISKESFRGVGDGGQKPNARLCNPNYNFGTKFSQGLFSFSDPKLQPFIGGMPLPELILAVLFSNFHTIATCFIIPTEGFVLSVIILRCKRPLP